MEGVNTTMSDNQSLKEAALEYAASSFLVFPLVPRQKTPATKNGFYADLLNSQYRSGVLEEDDT